MRTGRIVSCALLALCALFVLWVRALPLSLQLLDDRAEHAVRAEIGGRLAPGIDGDLSAARRAAELERRTTEWVKENRKQYDAAVAERSRELKSQLRFEGGDGREYVYLGDLDSYLWLRNARNYLRQGTTCDAIVDGECRDTYGMAPVGHRMLYDRSLHIAVIVGLHKTIGFFDPLYPLPATSFWVPVLAGVLGVIPAFLLGKRVAGNMGGLFAAMVISLHPVFLIRTIGSDNDVWNVVLPLFALWALVHALDARGMGLVLWGIVAGGFMGLHAAAWRGWIFFYVVFLGGLLSYLGLSALRFAMTQRTDRLWLSREAGRVGLACVVFYVAAGMAAVLAGSEEPYLNLPLKLLGMGHGISADNLESLSSEAYWPNVFETVAELLRPQAGLITAFMGAGIYLIGAATGLAMMLFSTRRYRRHHMAFFLTAVPVFTYIVMYSEAGRGATVALLALPFAAAALLSSFDRSEDDAAGATAMILAAWFVGAFHLAYDGLRFLLLLIVPFGIGAAFIMGRLFGYFRRLAAEVSPSRGQRRLWDAAIAAVVLLFLIPPLQAGYMVARNYLPKIDDAWWDALVKIREESSPDAIVNAWWDYGYWIKYAAGRRVSADGGSLRTHVHHWLGRALAAPDERETIGILRMLNCGSDATPLPEGRLGAYGKIVGAGRDGVHAYAILSAIVRMSEVEARSYLFRRGLTSSQQEDILRSSHCAPPESYLIVGGDLLRKAQAWMRLGLWDVRKALIAEQAGSLSREEALSDWVTRLGFTEEEALELYSDARTLASSVERRNFTTPRVGRLPSGWLRCTEEPPGSELDCPLGPMILHGRAGSARFSYDPASPERGKILFSPRGQEKGSTGAEAGWPAVVVVAGREDLSHFTPVAAGYRDLGILVDVPKGRILAGSPSLVRSTFVQLFYLDGRYSKRFEKFDERTTFSGDRLLTWKIDWGGR